jgi:hypothetical protein
MRNAAHENPVAQSRRIEYWFSYFDGSVMLCEPIKKDGCGASTTIFSQDESGAMVKSSGFELMCVSAKWWIAQQSVGAIVRHVLIEPGRETMISTNRPRCRAVVFGLVAMLVSAVLCGCATQPTEVMHKVVMTKVRSDPAHPVRLGENYPPESKILGEEGVCKVKLTVTWKTDHNDLRDTDYMETGRRTGKVGSDPH